MIAALECPFGIHQNVGDILGITDLVVSFADLEQRIVGGAQGIGRIEQEHRPKLGAEARGQLEILALDVMDDRGIRRSQKSRDGKTDALARVLAPRVYVLNNGHVVFEGTREALQADPELAGRYLGIGIETGN